MPPRSRFTLLVLLMFSVTAGAAAGTDPVASWTPPEPTEDGFDWVQLISGEWLKGRFKAMQEDVLEFDSDKLDLQKIDWEDVRAVHSAHPMQVFYGDDQLAVGYLRGDAGQLVILTPDELRIPMVSVLTIATGTPREIDRWSADISLLANLRSGNSDQIDITAGVSLVRRTAKTRLTLSYDSNYSEQNNVRSTDDQRGRILADIFFSRKWFARVLQLEYNRDPFQNIDSQYNVGFGVGYFIFNQPKLEWSVSAGPGYQRTRFVEVEAGKDQTESTPALVLGTQYKQDLTSRIDVQFDYQLRVVKEQSGRAAHDAVLKLGVDLTKRLDLDVSLAFDRIEEPEADAAGVLPEKNDFRLGVGLGLEF